MKPVAYARFLLAAVVLAMQAACLAGPLPGMQPARLQLQDTAPQRILFIGNSYLYYNDSLHNHVRRIAEEAGPHGAGEYQYKSATIGGASLSQHPVDALLQPGRLGIDAPFDLVILQGGSAEPLSDEGRRAFAQHAAKLNDRIRATGAEVALYMTHAYVEPHERFDPDMIESIHSLYVQTANEIDALVIPVGLAFERAYSERPDLQLHKSFDGSHPSLLGTYLAACVVYTSIYRRSLANVEYDYFGAVGRDDARFLRRIAEETVAGFH